LDENSVPLTVEKWAASKAEMMDCLLAGAMAGQMVVLKVLCLAVQRVGSKADELVVWSVLPWVEMKAVSMVVMTVQMMVVNWVVVMVGTRVYKRVVC
jgi:hypothetical protein